MANNYSYKGFHQAGLSMSSNSFGLDPSYGRVDSNSQPSYYSAIDKTYQMHSNTGQNHQSFRIDHAKEYSARPPQALYDAGEGPYIGQQGWPGTRPAPPPEENFPEPTFGVDFSEGGGQQSNRWEQFQQHFQQAFEQQLSHQINLQLQQGKAAFGSDFGRPGDFGSSTPDGAAAFFGDDNVGKRKGGAGSTSAGQGDIGWVKFGEDRPGASNPSTGLTASSQGPSKVSKFHCSTCDVSYASSLAFTSHLGSSDHKMKREKEVSRPKLPILVAPEADPTCNSSQQTTSSQTASTSKSFTCQLCKVTLPGASVYAAHIKSEGHQRILKANNENKRRNNSAAAPSTEFGSNVNIPRGSEEFIEEIKNFNGSIVRVVCNLCRVDIPNPMARIQHLQSYQHRNLYEQKLFRDRPLFGQDLKGDSCPLFGQQLDLKRATCKMPSPSLFGREITREEKAWGLAEQGETQDDACVRCKHSLIYPTPEDFKVVQRVSGSCERWLKTVMNNLKDGSGVNQITEVLRVGQLAKGLLLHYDLSCDFLVLLRDWPTKSHVVAICKELEVLKEKNTRDNQPPEYALSMSEGGDCIFLENFFGSMVRCTIHVSSRVVKVKEEGKGTDPGKDGLELEACLKNLEFLDSLSWFQVKGIPLPSCILVLRVLKDTCRGRVELQCLPDEVLESLVVTAINDLKGNKRPATILTRAMELLSSSLRKANGESMQLGEDSNPDAKTGDAPCNKVPETVKNGVCDVEDLLRKLSTVQREDALNMIEKLLKEISLGKLREILELPESDTRGSDAEEQAATDAEDRSNSDKVDGAEIAPSAEDAEERKGCGRGCDDRNDDFSPPCKVTRTD